MLGSEGNCWAGDRGKLRSLVNAVHADRQTVKFALAQSFDVDGELDSRAFVLGAEWGIVWQQAIGAAAFTAHVHSDNFPRIAAMLASQGRRYTARTSRGWATIKVAGLD